ncbi:MAG: hypothetical protein QW041_00390 [Candidatus Pacearchaeota archaeon]
MKSKNHLVIRFNLKKILPEDIRLGSKVPETLDKLVEEKIKQAVERARANKRTTILPQDI